MNAGPFRKSIGQFKAKCNSAAESCKALVFCRGPVFQTRDFREKIVEQLLLRGHEWCR